MAPGSTPRRPASSQNRPIMSVGRDDQQAVEDDKNPSRKTGATALGGTFASENHSSRKRNCAAFFGPRNQAACCSTVSCTESNQS
jgi:hypothetical protein